MSRRYQQLLTPHDIGAWLFKCNPHDWDIEAALKNGESVDSWRALETYRIGLVEAGQPAVIWMTGSVGDKPDPGIWMAGYTTGAVKSDRQGDEYWLDETERRKHRPYIGLRMARIEPIIPRQDILNDPRTAGMEVLRAPQMSNPSYLTPGEKEALEEMMGGWPI
jgi:hypothetical protein